jgi:hypothetical protein
MAARVTEAEVLAIMDTILVSADITPFVIAATLVIDEVSTRATYSAALLKELERYYTAHLAAALKDPTIKQEKTGEAAVTYLGEGGKGLEFTSYGQQVLVLDTEGVMASLGKQAATMQSLDIV